MFDGKNHLPVLARRIEGIESASLSKARLAPDLFRHACKFDLEGLFSKHRERACRAGPPPNSPQHPAMRRVKREVFARERAAERGRRRGF